VDLFDKSKLGKLSQVSPNCFLGYVKLCGKVIDRHAAAATDQFGDFGLPMSWSHAATSTKPHSNLLV
jgi:hypothetical protein